MPKKKDTSTRALTGPRTLTTQFEMASMYWDEDLPSSSQFKPTLFGSSTGSYANWNALVDLPVIYNETYLDLSGYELDDLTLVPMDVKVQDPGVYMYSGAGHVFCVYDILSDERLTEADIDQIGENNRTNRQSGPGMPRGPLDRSQIIFGLYRFFTNNTSQTGMPSLMLNSRTVRFGSGQPTTVQKLWAYRIVIFADSPNNDDFVTIPAATFVLNAQIVQEDTLPYMMRLKRSYELATGD
jgi:hypothetical protein